jgi:hypothetical protein
MTTGRSPNYPSLTLAEALERLKPLYDSIHTRPAEKEIIAQNLGYKGINGRSLTLIATLRRYGLLVQEGKGLLRISQRAVSILELGRGDEERLTAFKDAAFDPVLFSQLYNDFGERLPKDENLKHYLIKKEFLPKAAEEIIRVYRANLELVNEEGQAHNAAMTPHTAGPQHSVARAERERNEIDRSFLSKAAADLAVLGAAVPGSGKQLRFNISRDSEAQVIFTGPVTQEAIEKLAALLQLQKDTFPTQEELQLLEANSQGKLIPDN